MSEPDEISERCGNEGHPRYKGDVRCYCGARDYPPDTHDHQDHVDPPALAALTLPVVRRRPVSLDTAEVPCMDCHVGEPHVCRLLYWDTVTITEDEWGGYVVN